MLGVFYKTDLTQTLPACPNLSDLSQPLQTLVNITNLNQPLHSFNLIPIYLNPLETPATHLTPLYLNWSQIDP